MALMNTGDINIYAAIANQQDALISVIVPVFNNIDYLNDCISSIRRQTYSNIEIVLVDDGSTDGAGELCDKFAKEDTRIKVIHKTNAGQSSARNSGLSVAKGEFVCFVDSDDIIAESMIHTLYYCVLYDHTSVARIRFTLNKKDLYEKVDSSKYKSIVLSYKDVLKSVIYPIEGVDFSQSVCGTLYRRSILDGILFPDGEVYEEIMFNTHAFSKAKDVSYLNVPLYYYRVHNQSTTHAALFDKRILTDRVKHLNEQINFLERVNDNNLANLHKEIYGAELRFFIAYYQLDEYKDSVQKTLEDWKLSIPEILKLDADIYFKLKAVFRRLFPLIMNLHYRNTRKQQEKQDAKGL